MKFLKTYTNFIFEKKSNTATKIKNINKKQSKYMKNAFDFMQKDKDLVDDIKAGDGSSSNKIKSLLMKVKTQKSKLDFQKSNLKKKELEIKSKLDTLKKSKKDKG